MKKNDKARDEIAGMLTDELLTPQIDYSTPRQTLPQPAGGYSTLGLEGYGEGGSVDRIRRGVDPYSELGVRARFKRAF